MLANASLGCSFSLKPQWAATRGAIKPPCSHIALTGTMHMPVAAKRRVVSIDYAHRYGYELAVDAAEADPRILKAESRAEARRFFNETCMRARY